MHPYINLNVKEKITYSFGGNTRHRELAANGLVLNAAANALVGAAEASRPLEEQTGDGAAVSSAGDEVINRSSRHFRVS